MLDTHIKFECNLDMEFRKTKQNHQPSSSITKSITQNCTSNNI